MTGPLPEDSGFDEGAWRAEIEAWHAARHARLRSPDGWVALVGLVWVERGTWSLGGDAGNEVVVPGTEVPLRIGTLDVGEWTAVLRVEPGVVVTVAGEPVSEVELLPDDPGPPTVFRAGSVRIHLILRHGRLALRVRDELAPELLAFAGIEHFPIDPAWRIVAAFEPAPPRQTVAVPDVLGADDIIGLLGWVTFDVDGQKQRLAAVDGRTDDGALWLIFGDTTNADRTYPAGRFLYTEPPRPDGTVIIDFNRAYTPPCAFSPYATCPLPPPGNRLAVAILAGELNYRPASV